LWGGTGKGGGGVPQNERRLGLLRSSRSSRPSLVCFFVLFMILAVRKFVHVRVRVCVSRQTENTVY
jgi:hypothetical protein